MRGGGRERGPGERALSSSPHLLPFCLSAGKGGAVTARTTDAATGLATIDITGPSSAATFIACPPDAAVRAGGGLAVRLPWLDVLLKPLPAPSGPPLPAPPGPPLPTQATAIDITVRDAGGGTRRLRASTAHRAPPRITPAGAILPLALDPAPASGWCRVRLDLAALLARAYPAGAPFAEVVALRIHAACRLRCVYFADRAYPEGELPPEFRLVVGAGKDAAAPPASSPPVACV